MGIALAGKGAREQAPLWLLILATQGCDWVQAVACMTAPPGSSAMWSHSIPAALALGVLLSVVAFAGVGDLRAALVVGAVAVSHVLADYVTGVKPTWPGGPEIGLALYGRPVLDFLIESAVVAGGWVIYRRSLPLAARGGKLVWLLGAALIGLQLAGAIDLAFFPPVPKCR